MISNIKTTKQLLDKYQLHAKKRLGQNFLIDENILNNIITNANITKDTVVVEIGPGLGSLSQRIAHCAKQLIAYEIDKDMVEVLKETLAPFNNTKIINQDILTADILSDLKDYLDYPIKVIANLPYYITTAIITKLLSLNLPVTEYYFMVQKEVAYRLTSNPNTKDYGALTVLIKYLSDAEMLFNVSPNCFYPAPEVESTVILIRPIKRDYNLKFEPKFLEFVQSIFVQRRKTLLNNISSKYQLSKEEIKQKLIQNHLSETVRAENLSLEEIINLYKSFFE